MHLVSAFTSLILVIHQTHLNTCIAYASYLGNETDRATLITFKRKMIEDPQGIVSSWNESTSHCNWLGVSCCRCHAEERVDLGTNRFRGNIPEEFGRLFRLKTLILYKNELEGEMPRNLSSCVGCILSSLYNLTSIVYFDVGGNSLHGEIPPDIGNYFPHLRGLYITFNQFSGQVPHSLPNATGLEDLFLTSNSFTGKVPANLGNLRNLTMVSLSNNQLQTGFDSLHFLTQFTNCTKLEVLDFGHNKFKGKIPASIANLTNTLQSLFLGSNQITGNIPPEIEKLNGLQILALYNNSISSEIPPGIDNKLNGTIPKEVISLSSLSITFEAARNSLIGSLPLEVGNMSKIVNVDLSDNRLIGEIPSTLSQCLMLQGLNMAGNLFEGSLPPSLKTMIGLQYLDLSRNRLSGQIPIYFENFTVLEALNMSFNSFEGEVPQEGIFRDPKRLSIIGNKELCGGIKEFGLPACKVPDTKKQRKLPKLKLSITVTVLFLIMLTCFVVVVYWRRKSRTRPSVALPIDEPFQKVSYAKLRQVTNEFSPSNLIGQGSHGSVYRGMLDGNRPVAVKVLNLKQKGAFKSFLAECEALRNIRHRNLVNIITVCSSIDFTGAEFKALVYDLMPNGSLEQCENQHDMPKLSLSQRLDIAIDVVSAIEYLHHHCQTSIVHGDLKPSNILLDHDMVARVCDFGLATNQDASQCQASSSGLKGTIGYVAPEYGLGGTSSLQGDVYSFGILLLEMLTGVRPTDVMFKDGWTLHEFVKTTQHKSLVKILDPSLLSTEYPIGAGHGQISDANMVRFEENIADIMRIGVLCSVKLPNERMDMTNALSQPRAVKEKFLKHGM
ncbi:hypothetical protein BT93_I0439 [Corymbia citriodora subsp. variegata]|nr:hypothetical protein BT93_I0439 [Corymbia citriodora subsp. variegata]